MDSHKRSAQLERLEVVETGRRRRRSEDEKLRTFVVPPTSRNAFRGFGTQAGQSRSRTVP